MRRLLLAIVLALAAPVAAQAQTGQTIFDTSQDSIPRLIVYATATSSSGCTVGIKGCLASASFDAVTSVSLTGPSATLAAPPYGGRVRADLYDDSSNGTLACTGQRISGYNTAGFAVTEDMGALSESGDVSNNAFRQITAYSATGCSGGATSDVLRLSLVGDEVGVPVQMTGSGDILSIAVAGGTDGSSWHACRSGAAVTGLGYSVDISACVWEGTGIDSVDGIRLSWQVKGKRFVRYLVGP